MYGTQVPTMFAAGIPGALLPFTLGATHAMWIVLMAVTVTTLFGVGLRLLPRRGA